ncbi:MAG TPA: hypothetical protein VJU86_18470 [Pyrinomonadaceae bacterium]|nr:hypothetical protein [Pyrinomonadaceae bacterium]
MNKQILAFSLSLACAVLGQAQTTETSVSGQGSSQNSATIASGAKSLNLESNTSLTAELQNTIDVRKAQVGDQVVLKTTESIKSGGQTVVKKGARLIGHVSEVVQRGKASADSRVAIIFDRLEHGSLSTPITATITSITNARVAANSGNDEMFGANASGSGRATTASSGSGGGGLAGGVGAIANSTTSTVGSVVGGTTSAVGSTLGSTTNTVGSTTAGLGRSLGRVRVSESSSTSAQGSSVLSLQGDNLRLEKGTSFNLVVNQSAGAAVRDE